MQEYSIQGFHLSPHQRTLLPLQIENSAYCVQCAVWLEGQLDRAVLKLTLQDIVNRHQILRTTFHKPPGITDSIQCISKEADLIWQEVELDNYGLQEQEMQIAAFLHKDRHLSYSLNKDFLFRVTLLIFTTHCSVLNLTLPGICADSQSLQNIVQEIKDYYIAHFDQNTLQNKVIQYIQFSEWQNRLLQEIDPIDLKEGTQYWYQQTSKVTTLPKIPFDTYNNEPFTFYPEIMNIELDSDLNLALKSLAYRYNTSVSTILFTCWHIFIHRITRSNYNLVNYTINGRKFDNLQHSLGLFAKVLPICFQYENNIRFNELLTYIDYDINQLYEWQEYFHWENYPNINQPYVDFEYQEWIKNECISDLIFFTSHHYNCIRPFILKLLCINTSSSIEINFCYDSLRLRQEYVDIIISYFITLLNNIISQPNGYIDTFKLLSSENEKYLLHDLNSMEGKFSCSKTICQLIEEQVARTPDSDAIVFGSQRLTYTELNIQSNQLAHLLQQQGVGPDVLVGLCVERSPEMIISLLAILKAGGTYVPLDPENPKSRLAYQIDDSKPSFLLIQDKVRTKLPDFVGEIICVDKLSNSQINTLNPLRTTNYNNLAYVIYTSGSTGEPKGVAITHLSLVNYTLFMIDRLKLSHGTSIITASTIAADLGNTAIFPALASGGCVHVLSYEVATNSSLYTKYITGQKIDIVKMAPSHFRTLVTLDENNIAFPKSHVILGGEPLSFELLERIRTHAKTCEIINHYGPTETTIGSVIFQPAEKQQFMWSSTVPIGRAISNVEAYILDQKMTIVPIGVPGEIYVGGVCLARGYLNKPTQTADNFRPNPLSHVRGARLYKTGDLARYLPDGTIEFLGRIDYQIKIRGFRVELGEIEVALLKHPSVLEAVVVVSDDASRNEKRIIAYIVFSKKITLTTTEWRQFLRDYLPDYMIPTFFCILESIPLTKNGKVDRLALPCPESVQPTLQTIYVIPKTQTERIIAGIWQEVLHIEKVGIDDNFFDLGGHSLILVQIQSKLYEYFQKDIPIIELFKYPTIATLAKYLTNEHIQTTSAQAQLRGEMRRISVEKGRK